MNLHIGVSLKRSAVHFRRHVRIAMNTAENRVMR